MFERHANPTPEPTRIDRRGLLVAGASAVLLAACSSSGGTDEESDADGNDAVTNAPSEPTDSAGADAAPTIAASGDTLPPFSPADFESRNTCSTTPEATAGPFPLDEQFDRRDITEGYPGHPMRLGFRVLDDQCDPVPDAVVEVWHADATGDYSAFEDGGDGKDEGEGTTFLRGSQTADDEGIVEFATIYPGWYGGRTVHIHLRVHVDDDIPLTTQVYFDDAYTAGIFGEGVYAENGPADTTNADDGLAGDPAADGTLLALSAGATSKGAGTVALLNIGIG